VKACVGLNLMLARDAYVQRAELHMQARLDSQRPFLWTDKFPNPTLQVRRGRSWWRRLSDTEPRMCRVG
jgi:hypothetical protein